MHAFVELPPVGFLLPLLLLSIALVTPVLQVDDADAHLLFAKTEVGQAVNAHVRNVADGRMPRAPRDAAAPRGNTAIVLQPCSSAVQAAQAVVDILPAEGVLN